MLFYISKLAVPEICLQSLRAKIVYFTKYSKVLISYIYNKFCIKLAQKSNLSILEVHVFYFLEYYVTA
jgi:hypothetical protein